MNPSFQKLLAKIQNPHNLNVKLYTSNPQVELFKLASTHKAKLGEEMDDRARRGAHAHELRVAVGRAVPHYLQASSMNRRRGTVAASPSRFKLDRIIIWS